MNDVSTCGRGVMLEPLVTCKNWGVNYETMGVIKLTTEDGIKLTSFIRCCCITNVNTFQKSMFCNTLREVLLLILASVSYNVVTSMVLT